MTRLSRCGTDGCCHMGAVNVNFTQTAMELAENRLYD
jgi:hypothetical protein